MNKLECEFLEDRRKYRKRELNTFYVSIIIFAIISHFYDFPLWWVFIIIMVLFAILDVCMRILNYLDVCSCLLEEQNKFSEEEKI